MYIFNLADVKPLEERKKQELLEQFLERFRDLAEYELEEIYLRIQDVIESSPKDHAKKDV